MSKRKKRRVLVSGEAIRFENGVEVSATDNNKGPAHIWLNEQEARENLVLEELQTVVVGRARRRARRMDNVERLKAAGVIDQRMYDAGLAFKQDFNKGMLTGFPAPKFEYMPPTTGEKDQYLSVEKARRRVHSAIQALGGHGSAASKAVWDFVGLELSIASMHKASGAARQKWEGILIGALAGLAAHYFPLSKK